MARVPAASLWSDLEGNGVGVIGDTVLDGKENNYFLLELNCSMAGEIAIETEYAYFQYMIPLVE